MAKIKDLKDVYWLVAEILDIQASILIHGATDYKRKRITKRCEKLAEICGVAEEHPIWYE